MKSLNDEYDKIREYVEETEEIVDNKDTISLYSLSSIIRNELNDLSKYDSDFQDVALSKIKEDFKKYKYDLFKNKRKDLKKLTPSGLNIIIKNNYDKRWDYEITLYIKTGHSNYFGYIELTKKEDIEDICIKCAGDLELSEGEKNNIKRFIVNHYHDDIIRLFYGMEKITKHYRMLKETDLNKLNNSIRFKNPVFTQTFDNELFEVEFNTYMNGINNINISLSDRELNNILQKDLLFHVELEWYMLTYSADILKRFSVNIKDLNPIYQDIVTNSKYYKNLDDVKKLIKK